MWFDGERLTRELLLEVERLNNLEEHFYAKELDEGEGATAAGALYAKLAERKATLFGLNVNKCKRCCDHSPIPCQASDFDGAD